MEQTKSEKKQVKKSSNNKQVKKEGFFRRIGRKFKEMWSELKKITWPNAKTVFKNTGIVLVVVLVFFLVILGFDALMGELIGLLFK